MDDRCSVCDADGRLECTGCATVYCSVEHQLVDWKAGHWSECSNHTSQTTHDNTSQNTPNKDLLHDLRNESYALCQRGEYEKALFLALEISEPEVQDLILLSEIYKGMNDDTMSWCSLIRASQACRKRLSVDVSANAMNCGGVAQLCLSQGYGKAADIMFEEYMMQISSVYGRDHIITGDCYYQLGSLSALQGQYYTAIDLITSSRDIREKILGPEARASIDATYSLGILMRIVGKSLAAIDLLKLVAEAYEKYLDIESPALVDVYISLAASHSDAGMIEEAHKCASMAVEKLGNRVDTMRRSQVDSLFQRIRSHSAIAPLVKFPKGNRSIQDNSWLRNSKLTASVTDICKAFDIMDDEYPTVSGVPCVPANLCNALLTRPTSGIKVKIYKCCSQFRGTLEALSLVLSNMTSNCVTLPNQDGSLTDVRDLSNRFIITKTPTKINTNRGNYESTAHGTRSLQLQNPDDKHSTTQHQQFVYHSSDASPDVISESIQGDSDAVVHAPRRASIHRGNRGIRSKNIDYDGTGFWNTMTHSVFALGSFVNLARARRIRVYCAKLYAVGIFTHFLKMHRIYIRDRMLYALGSFPCILRMRRQRHRQEMASKYTGPKLKGIFWETMKDADGTLWKEMTLNPFAHDPLSQAVAIFPNLVESFVVPDIKSPGGSVVSASVNKDRACVLDQKRLQTLNVALNRLPDIDSLVGYVYQCDASALTLDSIHELLKVSPTPEELVKVRSFVGDNEDSVTSELDVAERYALAVSKVDNFTEKLRCMEFMKSYPECFENIRRQLAQLTKGCSEIKTSKSWKQLLKIILLLGNALNASSSTRGYADGIKLTSLLVLTNTKTYDGSNVLAYVVDSLLSHPEHKFIFDNISNELGSISKLDRCSFESIGTDMAKLQGGLNLFTFLIGKCIGHTTLVEELEAHREYLAPAVNEIDKEIKAVRALFNSCCAYYGEPGLPKNTPADIFGKISQFLQQVEREIKASRVGGRKHKVKSPLSTRDGASAIAKEAMEKFNTLRKVQLDNTRLTSPINE